MARKDIIDNKKKDLCWSERAIGGGRSLQLVSVVGTGRFFFFSSQENEIRRQ